MQSPDIIHVSLWASQECAWQRSGEKSVGRLVEAVTLAHLAQESGSKLTEDWILAMGRDVDDRNQHGYRQENVWVSGHLMPGWGDIPMMMGAFVNLLSLDPTTYTPTEAFKSFEEIHPFVDGNGRVGAIIYNWLNGTLHPGKLEFPPNVFGDPRRD